MSELFQVGESLSPRLRWMRRHGITTEFDGKSLTWFAHTRDYVTWSAGDTEHDAIVNLAERKGIRLWNEEQTKEDK